jgi:hypothetical protein
MHGKLLEELILIMDRVTSDLHEAQIGFWHYPFHDMLAARKKQTEMLYTDLIKLHSLCIYSEIIFRRDFSHFVTKPAYHYHLTQFFFISHVLYPLRSTHRH